MRSNQHFCIQGVEKSACIRGINEILFTSAVMRNLASASCLVLADGHEESEDISGRKSLGAAIETGTEVEVILGLHGWSPPW